MTQHIESLKIGEKLAFVGPKGRNKYLGNGNFISHTLDGTNDNQISGKTTFRSILMKSKSIFNFQESIMLL